MKAFLLIILVLPMTALASSSAIQWNVAINYEKVKNDPIVNSYMLGATNAFVAINAKLESQGQKELFCQPETFAFNLDNLNDIIVKAFPNLNKKYGSVINYVTLDKVLLDEITLMFPCR